MQKWRAALDEITGDVLSEAPTSQPKETQMQESVQKVVEPTPDDAVAATDGTDEEEVDTECQT
jgi:hypothetical protein